MAEDIWLSMDEVCKLTGEVKETVRRKCKRGEYSCTFEKNGKYKNYLINLDSLPEVAKNKYNGIKINVQHSKFYKESPAWAKKQAKKYVELIEKTSGMKHKEIVEFLKDWNLKHPDKKSSYSALCKARIKYEQFGEDALLSKKGFKEDEYCIKPEYYEHYKKLYLSPKSLSAIDCWIQTLNYAKQKDKIKTANFPCDKTFDRLLKKEYSAEEIKRARRHHEKVIAKDYSNIRANEYWIVESCQLKFQIKYKNTYYYPWLTVVKDVKTEKWLGWFVFHEILNSDYVLQAVYYALIKYGSPSKIIIRNVHFDSYIAKTGKVKKAGITYNRDKLLPILFYSRASLIFDVPVNVNTCSITYDLKEFMLPNPNTNIFDFKEILDYHVQAIINQRIHRNQLFNGKSSNELWQENYEQQELPNKESLIDMCLRTKKPIKYQKNGIYDSVTNRHYWGDWMLLCTSKSMYLKRDIYSEDDGFLYDGEDQRGLGSAYVLKAVPALWKTEEERELVKQEIARKKRALKNTHSFLAGIDKIPFEEQVENYKAVYHKEIPEAKPKVIRILQDSHIEATIRKMKEIERSKKLKEKVYSQMVAESDEYSMDKNE